MDKTLQQLSEEHSKNAASLLHRYHDKADEIRRMRGTSFDFGEYETMLTPQQKAAMVEQRKRAMAEEVGSYIHDVEQMRRDLKAKLFKTDYGRH